MNQSIELTEIIKQRLNLPTVKRNLLTNFGVDVDVIDDLFKGKNLKLIQNFSTYDKNKFIIELGGRANFNKTQRYINENIL